MNKKNVQRVRLIDANAMYQRFCVDKSGLDGIYDSTDLPDMLAGMPTIDAIPVEWLEAHKMECIDDWGVVPISIWRALKMWQKEQEAQDE